jgi:pimeloyl-ACP methyl ester carboxylesterase
MACSKDEEPSEDSKTVVMPDIPGNHLVQYTNLGAVSLSSIKLAMDLAGYGHLADYMKYSIKLYKLVYKTTYKGQPIKASGLISFPLWANDSLPAMIVGNGLTFADKDAPTAFELPQNFTGFEFIGAVGYFTLIPDMIGFGASSDRLFPIHNYEHSATTMIDFIYACDELIEELHLPVTGNKYLAGYSQGGHIALSTLKMIEEKPVADIKIVATAVGAGGFNLPKLLNHAIDENMYTAPSHIALLISSYNIMYGWNRPLSDFFAYPFYDRIPELLNGAYDREQIDEQLTYKIDSLFTPEFLQRIRDGEETDLMNALQENSIDDWRPEGKLLVMHSTLDDRIPISDSQDMYNNMLSRGASQVSFMPIETPGHIDAGATFVLMAIEWLQAQ